MKMMMRKHEFCQKIRKFLLFLKKKCKKIWLWLKLVVLLHPLSAKIWVPEA